MKSKFLFFGPFEGSTDWSNFSAPPLAKEMNIQPYGSMADKQIPRLEEVLKKF